MPSEATPCLNNTTLVPPDPCGGGLENPVFTRHNPLGYTAFAVAAG